MKRKAHNGEFHNAWLFNAGVFFLKLSLDGMIWYREMEKVSESGGKRTTSTLDNKQNTNCQDQNILKRWIHHVERATGDEPDSPLEEEAKASEELSYQRSKNMNSSYDIEARKADWSCVK